MVDIDVLRGARSISERYGTAAELEAECCTDRLLSVGDVEGYRVWLQVIGAIRETRTQACACADRIY